MKRAFALALIPAALLRLGALADVGASAPAAPETSAGAAILIHADTGEALY